MINKLDWIKKDQLEFLQGGYLDEGETIVERLQTICDTTQFWVDTMYSKQLNRSPLEKDNYKKVRGIGKRFEEYFEKGWVSLSTPVLKNFGKSYNLPISCNHSILPDTLSGIYKGLHETGMLAKYGAGTAVNFSDIRPVGSDISTGGTSNSILDWIEIYANLMSKTAQNRARRGFLTVYLSVDHPEIMDFLDIGTHRIPADKQRFFQTITTAVTLPEGWRDDLKTNPEKKKIFTKILNTRKETGFPYILDETNCNKDICQAYIDKGMKIRSSNICIEAMEYTDYEKTFACCLSAVNLYYYDEWKNDTNFIFDMNILLDCVIEEYIYKGSKLKGLAKAVKFAKEHRAIGLGTTAFVTYLQKNNIDVFAIDISKGAIETCNLRGIKNTKIQDIWQLKNQKFDTILVLMNGAGLCGKLEKLPKFLNHLKNLLNPNGQIVLDSTNVIYMFEDNEGNFSIDGNANYYGETTFEMTYKSQKSSTFDWLYIDFNTLQRIAEDCNLKCDLILEGLHFDYLARISFN